MDLFQVLQGLMLNQQQPNMMSGDMSGRQPVNSPQLMQSGIEDLVRQGLGRMAAIDAEEPTNMGGPEMPIQRPVPASNTANHIRKSLGDNSLPEAPVAQGILSKRFQEQAPIGDTSQAIGFNSFGGGPSYADFGTAIAKSAGGKVTSGQEIYDARSKDTMTQLAAFQKLAGGEGGATGQLVRKLQQENPNLSFRDALYQVQTGFRQGTTFDDAGNIISAPGYAEAKGNVKYNEQSGKNRSDLEFAAPTGYAQKRGDAAGTASIKNDDTISSLNTLDDTITEGRKALATAGATGPIFGRIGNAANDPEYKNLQGYVNSMTLQAKDLYNLGSGQGFSDNDLKFLGDVTAGKYSKAETIKYAFDRMENLSEKRRQFISSRNQSYNNEFGYGGQPTQSAPSNGPDLNDPGFQAFLQGKGYK